MKNQTRSSVSTGLARVAMGVLAAAVLAGCGQKGPLFLPRPGAAAAPSTAASAPAPATAPASTR